jgi:glycosyltransferase involved in cell wall biosynthesis
VAQRLSRKISNKFKLWISISLAGHGDSILSFGKIAALIPAFNEEPRIGSVVLKTKRYVNDVFVVDDGSTDSTAMVAELAGAKVIRLEVNSGYSSALLTGFQQIRLKGYSAVVMLDADGQHDPTDIDALLAPILASEADLVIGSRFLDKQNNIPKYRKLGNTVLNKATNIGARREISDSQSGFRALGKNAINSLDFKSDGMNLASDMIFHFASLGLKIVEVPINVRYDIPKENGKNPISHGTQVLNSIIGYIGYRRPLMIFGIPAAIMFSSGLILGILTINQDYMFGWGWLFQSILSMMLVIVGTMLAIAALTLNSLVIIMREENVPKG